MGQLIEKQKRPRYAIYESGDVYGYLTLTGKSYMKPKKNGSARYVEYICQCGKIGWTTWGALGNGHTKSCGCLHRETVTTQHGLSTHPLMSVWQGINERCYKPEFKYYKNYGGRGVTVCDEWRDNYKAFYDWAIDKWKPGLELDKDKLSPTPTGIIYSPEFCCFITHQENTLYTSKARMIQYNGTTKNLSVWCNDLSLDYCLMRQRIVRDKWSAERAFETPITIKHRTITKNNK